MFADRARIYVRSGKGGDGHVSFRREKYVPDGGPDGGDGGNGGSVIFVIDDGLNTLADFKQHTIYKAGFGEDGGKRNCHGKNAPDLYIKVPEGTVIKEEETGKVIADMSGDNRSFVLLQGGHGGNGNQHYATSTMQAPKYAQPGQPARELNLILELKVIADVGLIGFPNVGKSTLLARTTNAKPKIANYHFTTLNPHLGVIALDEGVSFVMADIPGLIEGASEGVGLGHEFLRHIERTKLFIHVVDIASTEGRDPIEDIYTINKELGAYNKGLLDRPQIIAANKIDAMPEESEENLKKLREEFEPQNIRIMPISAVSGQGVRELMFAAFNMLKECKEDPVIFEPEFFPEIDCGHSDEPFSVTFDEDRKEYLIEGPRIEKMLGYTNLESEKGFLFFQNFMKDNGILDQLEQLGIKEGDTVRIYGWAFSYYK